MVAPVLQLAQGCVTHVCLCIDSSITAATLTCATCAKKSHFNSHLSTDVAPVTAGTGSSDKFDSRCVDVLIYCWKKYKPGTKQYGHTVWCSPPCWLGQGRRCWRVHDCSSVNNIQHAYAPAFSDWVFASQLQCYLCLSDCISMSLVCKHTNEAGCRACLLFRPVTVTLHFHCLTPLCSQFPISAWIDASQSGCREDKRT